IGSLHGKYLVIPGGIVSVRRTGSNELLRNLDRKIRKSKSEIRNKVEIRKKQQHKAAAVVSIFSFSYLFRISTFGFRICGSPAQGIMCQAAQRFHCLRE